MRFNWQTDDTGLSLEIGKGAAIWLGLWIGLRRFWFFDMTLRSGVQFWLGNRKIYDRIVIDKIIML